MSRLARYASAERRHRRAAPRNGPPHLFLLPPHHRHPPRAGGNSGTWSTTRTRVYASPSQLGTGSGPYREVTHARWTGVIECTLPLAGIAMLHTAGTIHWAKSNPPVMNPALGISLYASGPSVPTGAQFRLSFHETLLPSVPIDCGPDLPASCTLASPPIATGRVFSAAHSADVTFALLLLPAPLTKVGRNRLWRLRDNVAAALPEPLRAILTRGRAGQFSAL